MDAPYGAAEQEHSITHSSELDPATKTALLWRYAPHMSPESRKRAGRGGRNKQGSAAPPTAIAAVVDGREQVCSSCSVSKAQALRPAGFIHFFCHLSVMVRHPVWASIMAFSPLFSFVQQASLQEILNSHELHFFESRHDVIE
jgi:hypothetical protein